MMVPSDSDEASGVFEFDLAVGTWVDCKSKEFEDATPALEQRANVLAATLSVAIPSCTVRRLARNELKSFLETLLFPRDPKLPQEGTSSTVSALEPFHERSPSAAPSESTPDFYVPNAQESGRGGILLGRVRSKGAEHHELSLQLDDLKRHVVILGMTGAGKSTTSGFILKQVAEIGLPVMVLDWHNEYREVVESVGGSVFAPGNDDFVVNPLQMSNGTEPAEHVAMVSDIFADIYNFTHPQAYMFRNALQKCIGETAPEEVPNLSSLVKTIEAYPLRSAYDNETKVALLRRLVPLTQGQVGRALNAPNTYAVEALLDRVVCVELGHIRDTLTRGIFAAILLKMVYEYRTQRKGELEHVLIVEEARNIAPLRKSDEPPGVGERMISELRKFGEAMIFVAQFPSQIAPEVVKNCGVRIIHRIAWAEDLKLVSEALNLTPSQLRHVGELGVGEAVVSVSRMQRPVLVQISSDYSSAAPRSDLSFSAVS
jgi:hypothetical protein